MRPGPRPKPTAQRTLEGDPGKLLRKRKREPKPAEATGDQLAVPTRLGRLGQAEWRRIVPELTRISVLTVVDLGQLEIYCTVYDRWARAQAVLKRSGLTMTSPANARVSRPEVAIVHQAETLLRQYAAEFGLTPAGRVGLKTGDEPTSPLQAPAKGEAESRKPGKVLNDPSRFFDKSRPEQGR